MRARPTVGLVVTLLTLCAFLMPALAGAESVPVPNVVGQSSADAVAELAARGFIAATIEVAGTPPDTVARQEPAAGNPAPSGSPVTIFVRRSVAVATTAPNAVGLSVGEANSALGSVYLLKFERTTGTPDQAGKVVAQSPAPGAPIDFRGELGLRFVPDAGLPSRVVVPDLLGLSAADAQLAAADAGLHARIAHAAVAGAPSDVTIAQRPSAGTEVSRYWTVDVVVSTGEGGTAPAPSDVAVPNLTDLTESAARAELDVVGLVADVEWVVGDPARAFLVDSQDPPPGTNVPAGSTVRAMIVKYAPPAPPTPPPAQHVLVPNLIGRTQQQAEALLGWAGLVPNPVLLPNSAYPPFRVFGQQTAPNSVVPAGTPITFRVAKPPAPPAPVPVPNFYLRTKSQALAMAALAGLGLDVDEVMNPVKPPNRVYAQSEAAGTIVPLGTTVAVKIAKHPIGPAMKTVPNLMGKTAAQANFLLAAASLAGDAHEAFALGKPPFKVFTQNPAPGTSVPVGTTVHFTIAKPLVALKTVPNVFGKTKAQAEAAILAAGLTPDVDLAVAPGHPLGKVYTQNPAAGQHRPAGTVVHAKVAMPVLGVSVPNLIGLTHGQANAALAAKGLISQGQVQFMFGKPPNKVYSQSKLPGSIVPPGTIVKWKRQP